MWYVPWLNWTVARWVVGEPATHDACNRLLARFPGLRDLHPGNVVVGRGGAVVEGFGVRASRLVGYAGSGHHFIVVAAPDRLTEILETKAKVATLVTCRTPIATGAFAAETRQELHAAT